MSLEDLRGIYEAFCSFGSSKNLASPHSSMDSLSGPTMEGSKFAKFCRDNRLIDNKRVTSTDVDIIFNRVKAKGSRKLDWATFQSALLLVAEKKYAPKKGDEAFQKAVTELTLKGRGPVSTGTVPQNDAVVERMTDTSLYTGTHKLRFDEDGQGRGLEGRDQPSKTGDLSKITNREETSLRGLPVSADPAGGEGRTTTASKRSHKDVTTASSERLDLQSSKPKKVGGTPSGSTSNLAGAKKASTHGSTSGLTKKPSIASAVTAPQTKAAGAKTPSKTYKATQSGTGVFDRLTNTSGYTGSHKERFNADGTGRGLAGRDAPAKGGAPGTYRGGDVKDLSQILRT